MFGKGLLFGRRTNAGQETKNAQVAKSSNGAKTTFYRNHFIKKHPDGDELWGTSIQGQALVGKLENIKKSINNWYETKVIVPPEHFELLAVRPANRQVVEYHGFKIINDTGGEKEWYLTHKGKLLKGSRVAIEKKIDAALEKARARKEAESNRSVTPAKPLAQVKNQPPV